MSNLPAFIDPEIDNLESFEDVFARLQNVEMELSRELRVSPNRIRRELLRRLRNGSLDDSELVMDWHAAYLEYRCLYDEAIESHPPSEHRSAKREEEGVASATLSFFVT